jgi:hypothetical protein
VVLVQLVPKSLVRHSWLWLAPESRARHELPKQTRFMRPPVECADCAQVRPPSWVLQVEVVLVARQRWLEVHERLVASKGVGTGVDQVDPASVVT